MSANVPLPGLIRRMTEADLDMVLRWRNHPDVRAFMYTQHEIAPQEHAEWYERARVDERRYLLVYEEGGVPCGFVNFSEMPAGRNSIWGFYAAPSAPWGAGRRMGRAAVAYGFDKAGFHKISGEALAHNEKSIRFHLSLGFQQEGVLRDHFFDNGKYQDVVCFGLLSAEWRREQESPSSESP